jgi:hypothetical protein
MRRSTYSLATVFLVVAIVAIAAASLRGLWVRVTAAGASQELLYPAIVCAIDGMLFATVLAFWSRTGSIWDGRNLVRLIVYPVAGLFLGAAAGAQSMAEVSWGAMVLTPPIVVAVAALVAFNRRKVRRDQRARHSNAAAEPERAPVLHPLDRPDPEPDDDASGPPDEITAAAKRR